MEEANLVRTYPKRHFLFLLSLLLAAALWIPAAGASDAIDRTRPVTLTIDYQIEEQPISGAAFDLYRVGEISGSGALTLSGAFQEYPVSLSGLDSAGWKALAETLYGYALRDSLVPTDSGNTDENGLLTFPTQSQPLSVGLYLVAGQSHLAGGTICTPEPFLLTLPFATGDNTYTYAPLVQPKYGIQTETDSVSRSVLKVWKDGQTGRPASIEVQLLKNGVVYDTVTLSQQNSWRHSWDGLDANARWQAVEKAVPSGYTVAVTQDNDTFVVTNSLKSPVSPSPSTLPQTGLLWWPVPLLTICGMLLFVLGWLRHQKAPHAE